MVAVTVNSTVPFCPAEENVVVTAATAGYNYVSKLSSVLAVQATEYAAAAGTAPIAYSVSGRTITLTWNAGVNRVIALNIKGNL